MWIRAVWFDLDGTLTVPCLDFDAMRAEMGIAGGKHLLEAMAEMSPAQRARAEAILHRHETVAARQARLNPGAVEVLARLRAEGRAVGLITRNSHASVQVISEQYGLDFDVVLTREDGPVKPDAYPIRRACERLGVAPEQSCMVGDYLHDMMAGRAAGAYTVLLCTHPRHEEFAGYSDFVIEHLAELHEVIARIETWVQNGKKEGTNTNRS